MTRLPSLSFRTAAPRGRVERNRLKVLPLLVRSSQLGGRLNCWLRLTQFPFSFKPRGLAVEIRNAARQRDAFYDCLRQAVVALCAMDAPSLPGLPTGPVPQTAPFAYVRMHGRNEEKWWNHELPEERYTYLYSKPELTIWSERVKRMSQDTKNIYVFFNNHFEGRAPANALTLLELPSND